MTVIMKKILTHPGQAHLDDFVGCSLLLAHWAPMAAIHRRQPTPEEIDDELVACVDVGFHHQPSQMCFDHHQDEPGLEETCAATLVALHVGLDFSMYDWWTFMEKMDCTGPYATAAWLGVDHDTLNKSRSPIGSFILRAFERETTIYTNNPLHGIMKDFGENLINEAAMMRQRQDLLDEAVVVTEVNGEKILVLMDTPKGLERWARVNVPESAVTVSVDDRGGGLALYRREDHPRVDFRRCPLDEDVEFIHKNGFVMKLRTQDLERATELVGLAIE